MSGRPLLVLGRSGQLARALAGLAPKLEFAATCLGRPEVELLQADAGALIERHRPALMVNAAAYTAVDRAESEPEAAFALNAELPGRFARAAAAAGVPFLQVSTDYVFEGTQGPYREDDARNPLGVYGRSKAAGEDAVLEADGPSAVVRTSWVYAAGGANFVATMLRLAEGRETVRVVADQRGCPTPAEDVARACILLGAELLAGRAAAAGVFHAAGAGEASWADFAEAIFALSAVQGGPSARVERITTADYPTAARRPADSRLDCSRLERTLGWRPGPWRARLEETIGGFLA